MPCNTTYMPGRRPIERMQQQHGCCTNQQNNVVRRGPTLYAAQPVISIFWLIIAQHPRPQCTKFSDHSHSSSKDDSAHCVSWAQPKAGFLLLLAASQGAACPSIREQTLYANSCQCACAHTTCTFITRVSTKTQDEQCNHSTAAFTLPDYAHLRPCHMGKETRADARLPPLPPSVHLSSYLALRIWHFRNFRTACSHSMHSNPSCCTCLMQPAAPF